MHLEVHQAHLSCVFKVIHRVAKLTLIRLMGDAIGQYGQGHDYCHHCLLQVRLHSSLKTEGNGCGTLAPMFRQGIQGFVSRQSRVLWSSPVGIPC